MSEILKIQDLVVRFYTYEGIVKAIEGVNLDLKEGETLGVVGETGCGKTVTSLSILVLVPPPGRIEGGNILFKRGKSTINLLELDERALRSIRGNEISMVFQEPGAALNPVYTVGEQIAETIILHRREELCKGILEEIEGELPQSSSIRRLFLRFEKWAYTKLLRDPDSLLLKFVSKIPILREYKRRLERAARGEAVKILRELRIPDPERVVDMYPHELSGGMKQRAVIAMALTCNPTLLIADEPTTNLDVTVQAQILHLIRELKRKFGSTVLYITHDLGVIAELCDRVAVMYAGTICEIAEVGELFKRPLHPYTRALLDCIPRPEGEFKSIKGEVPNLIEPPPGCRFHPRCPKAMDICSKVQPKMLKVGDDHFVACHLYQGD